MSSPRSLSDSFSSDEFRTAQLDRYQYLDDVTAEQVGNDINMLQKEWETRLAAAIQDEAKQTDNWSMLWKVESALSSLDAVIRRKIEQYLASQSSDYDSVLRKVTGSDQIGKKEPGLKAIKELYDTRKSLLERANRMFSDFKRWTKCGGELALPNLRPSLRGMTHLPTRIVDWFALPRLSIVPTFPLQRQVMMFGPPGSGKTAISNLVSYDLAERMKQAWIRSGVNAGDTLSDIKNIPAKEFVVTYYVDALRLRDSDPDVVQRRLRSYLHCLQYEIVQKRRQWSESKELYKTESKLNPSPPKPIALLVLDNLDALFFTDEELNSQPRPMRQSSQLRGYLYQKANDVGSFNESVARNAGGSHVSTPSGGDAVSVRLDGLRAGGGGNLEQLLLNLMSEARLSAEWPDIRFLWCVRYPWKLPEGLRRLVKGYELFVDLPNTETRTSQFELWLKQELFKNIAATIEERKALTEEMTRVNAKAAAAEQEAALKPYNDLLNEEKTRKGEADDNLFAIEVKLRQAVETRYNKLREAWKNSVLVPFPYQIVAYVIDERDVATGSGGGSAGVLKTPAAAPLLQDYLNAMKQVIEFLVNVTGMSLGGYCQMQHEHRLTFSEIDMFLITTGRRSDKGSGLTGATPYGFTMEDIVRMQDNELRQTINTRLLRSAINKAQAFVFGSQTWSAPGCQWTAREVQTKLANSSIDPNNFKLRDFYAGSVNSGTEMATCRAVLGPDLRDLETSKPIIPLSARFGSHRLLKDDAIKALTLFIPKATPKADYPLFVSYVLFGKEKLNRLPLPSDQISHICRAKPGPVSRLLQLSGSNPAPTAQQPQASSLSPFSLVFGNPLSPTIKFGGGGGAQKPHSKLRQQQQQRLAAARQQRPDDSDNASRFRF
jgi:hypothetical protein